jgi:hypothetical protein
MLMYVHLKSLPMHKLNTGITGFLPWNPGTKLHVTLSWQQNNITTSLFITLVMSLSPGQFTKLDSDTVLDMYTFSNNWWIKIHCAHFSLASFQQYFCKYIDHPSLQPHVLFPPFLYIWRWKFHIYTNRICKMYDAKSVTRTVTSHCAQCNKCTVNAIQNANTDCDKWWWVVPSKHICLSFILMACAFRSVCLAAGELLGIFILA